MFKCNVFNFNHYKKRKITCVLIAIIMTTFIVIIVIMMPIIVIIPIDNFQTEMEFSTNA